VTKITGTLHENERAFIIIFRKILPRTRNCLGKIFRENQTHTLRSIAAYRKSCPLRDVVESSRKVMAFGDAREGKWRWNWRMEWVASTLHTASERGVSSITPADAHSSPASSRLNWRPRRFKWTRPFRRKKKSGFCACAITFQTQSNARCSRRGRRWQYNKTHSLGVLG
jgi:hypothetical protein